MAQDQLFKQLCSSEVMKIGWHLAQSDSRDDFVSDPIGHADFASNLTAQLSHIIEQIENHRYRPRHLIELDVPKTGLSVRPGNVLPIEEAALLHAIIYLLAPHLDKKLDKSVYSYRLHQDWKKRARKGTSMFRETEIDLPFLRKKTIRSIAPFEAWYERWPQFEKDAKEAYTKQGYEYLTKTDITSYFENIDLRLLEVQIRSYLKREEAKILHLLFRILDGWTRHTSAGTPIGRGIPQGNDISSFLGNLYLIPLDRALSSFCRSRGAAWFRYVDDVKVFSKTKKDAREAVFVVNDALRSLHLNLQGSKTEILTGAALEQDLDDSDFEAVDKVLNNVRKFNPYSACDSKKITACLKPLSSQISLFRKGLPGCVQGLDRKQNRLFRRLMTVYGQCHRPHLRKSAVTAITELPDIRILLKTLSYLSQLDYKTHQETLTTLMRIVEEGKLLFPYQIGRVLETLSFLHPRKVNDVSTSIRAYALSKHHDWVVKEKALEAIFTYPYKPDYCETLAEKYLTDNYPLVRRAAILLLLRAQKHVARKRLNEIIYHADHSMSRIALYFQRFVNEESFAQQELARIKGGHQSDYMFLKTMPQMYAIAATENKFISSELYNYLDKRPASSSAKIAWHRGNLLDRVKWSTKTLASSGP